MIPSSVDSVAGEFPQKEDVVVDRGAHAPMSQQYADHGHKMHPQKLVHLVGCRDPKAAKHQEAA